MAAGVEALGRKVEANAPENAGDKIAAMEKKNVGSKADAAD